jgi:hypothetical protein
MVLCWVHLATLLMLLLGLAICAFADCQHFRNRDLVVPMHIVFRLHGVLP